MQKLFLLDAYALIFRAYYALIRSPRINSKGFNTSAIFGFVNTLEDLLQHNQPSHIGVAFDPAGPTFRHEAFAEYKAQRMSTPEDIRQSVPLIKEILRAYRIPILEVPGFEADDVIGTLAHQASQHELETYMVTPDKDYGQLVREHVWQFRPGSNGFETLGPAEICAKYDIASTEQVIDILGLMGDSADNVPGCPGVGEKTAASLIKTFGSIEGIYQRLDEVKGKLHDRIMEHKEQVLFSKYLVTIRQDVPITLDLAQLERKEIDKEALRNIFEQLEFRSFIKKLCDGTPSAAIATPSPQVQAPQQLDLFASDADDSPSGPKYENFAPENFTNCDYHLIENQEQLRDFLDKIVTFREVGLSFSTTSTSAIQASLVGVALCYRAGEAKFVPLEGTEEKVKDTLRLLQPLFESEQTTKVGHDLKFAFLLLKKYGFTMKGPLFDTMLAHYVIQPELNHSLPYLSEIYFHYTGQNLESYFGSKWAEERNMLFVPEDVRCRFECERADQALRLHARLTNELENHGAKQLFDHIELPLAPVLADMEYNGVLIDRQSLRETSKSLTARMHEYEEKVYALSGMKFNLSSPRQVGDVFFGKMQLLENPRKTKTGQYVTSEAVLEELRTKFPVVDNLLKYRGMKKLVSTYVDALPELVNPATGHIHTSFNQAITATGRLSSSNPNLQNIPVRGDDGREIRRAFIPEPDSWFFSADYSQIELRVMAHLSGDQHMIEAFCNGHDIHTATAAHIYHRPLADITDDERRKAKTANFGIIYGISAFGLAQRIGISRKEAKELIDNYFITFPRIKQYMETNIELARKQGYVETIFHRRRYLPDINSRNPVVRGYAERNAINAPIQGSAADIIKVAMIHVARRFQEERLRSKMILQVHDELNFSVVPEERELVEQIVKQEMEQAYQMVVPLIADCGWGHNWLEAH